MRSWMRRTFYASIMPAEIKRKLFHESKQQYLKVRILSGFVDASDLISRIKGECINHVSRK